MQRFLIVGWIVLCMIIAFMGHKWLVQLLQPRKSFGRMMLTFLANVIMIFLVLTLMIWVIGRLAPGELMKTAIFTRNY